MIPYWKDLGRAPTHIVDMRAPVVGTRVREKAVHRISEVRDEYTDLGRSQVLKH